MGKGVELGCKEVELQYIYLYTKSNWDKLVSQTNVHKKKWNFRHLREHIYYKERQVHRARVRD